MQRFFFPLVLMLAAVSTVAMAHDDAPPTMDAGNVHYAWANVTRVDPVYRTVEVASPRQRCYQQPVVRRQSGNTTAGTVIGAIVGGVLGNTIGKGDGRQAATAIGAVAGGVVGNRVAGRNGNTYEDTETRCQQVQDLSQERRIVGYNVEYRYRGEVYTSRLGYDPGTRLRVRVTVTPDD